MRKTKNETYCCGCNEYHNNSYFYKSFSPHFRMRGLQILCKNYINDYVKVGNEYSRDRLIEICRIIDAPYISEVWERSLLEKNKSPIQSYFATINLRYRGMTYENSEFGNAEIDEVLEDDNDFVSNISNDASNISMLKQRWGANFEPDTLIALEKKYNQLRVGYSEQTSMHTEALKKYVMASTMEEEAIAKGDAIEASKWGDLAIKYSKSAKIQPSQLTQSDLQGGLSNISEIVKAVEREEDIIEILPKFREAPQDDVDKTIELYIKSVKRLLGINDESSYKDLYKYIDKNVEERKQIKEEKSNEEDILENDK